MEGKAAPAVKLPAGVPAPTPQYPFSKAPLDLVGYFSVRALGVLWLLRQVEKELLAQQGGNAAPTQAMYETVAWEAIVNLLTGVAYMWAIERGDVIVRSSGTEGHPDYKLELQEGPHGNTLHTMRGAPACFMQRFVLPRYKASNQQDEGQVKQAITQE